MVQLPAQANPPSLPRYRSGQVAPPTPLGLRGRRRLEPVQTSPCRLSNHREEAFPGCVVRLDLQGVAQKVVGFAVVAFPELRKGPVDGAGPTVADPVKNRQRLLVLRGRRAVIQPPDDPRKCGEDRQVLSAYQALKCLGEFGVAGTELGEFGDGWRLHRGSPFSRRGLQAVHQSSVPVCAPPRALGCKRARGLSRATFSVETRIYQSPPSLASSPEELEVLLCGGSGPSGERGAAGGDQLRCNLAT